MFLFFSFCFISVNSFYFIFYHTIYSSVVKRFITFDVGMNKFLAKKEPNAQQRKAYSDYNQYGEKWVQFVCIKIAIDENL